ncbi:hypothetical protein Bca4012_080284 [Brassica carinata]
MMLEPRSHSDSPALRCLSTSPDLHLLRNAPDASLDRFVVALNLGSPVIGVVFNGPPHLHRLVLPPSVVAARENLRVCRRHFNTVLAYSSMLKAQPQISRNACMFNETASSIVETLKKANSILPHVVLASTVLALLYPPSFTWFTSRYFVPALGFLMFAVGINSNEKDFLKDFKRPKAILLGYLGQYLIKPLLGFIFGLAAVSLFQLPTPLGAGIMLVSCVSGAQLSNYATFLTDPALALLSIVMTFYQPLSRSCHTDAITLAYREEAARRCERNDLQHSPGRDRTNCCRLNKLFPKLSNAIRPLSTSSIAFLSGYFLTGSVFRNAPDSKALQRTLSYETGMQSSLLALALATKFFQDPLVGIPPAISTVVMSLMGFTLVMIWSNDKEQSI